MIGKDNLKRGGGGAGGSGVLEEKLNLGWNGSQTYNLINSNNFVVVNRVIKLNDDVAITIGGANFGIIENVNGTTITHTTTLPIDIDNKWQQQSICAVGDNKFIFIGKCYNETGYQSGNYYGFTFSVDLDNYSVSLENPYNFGTYLVPGGSGFFTGDIKYSSKNNKILIVQYSGNWYYLCTVNLDDSKNITSFSGTSYYSLGSFPAIYKIKIYEFTETDKIVIAFMGYNSGGAYYSYALAGVNITESGFSNYGKIYNTYEQRGQSYSPATLDVYMYNDVLYMSYTAFYSSHYRGDLVKVSNTFTTTSQQLVDWGTGFAWQYHFIGGYNDCLFLETTLINGKRYVGRYKISNGTLTSKELSTNYWTYLNYDNNAIAYFYNNYGYLQVILDDKENDFYIEKSGGNLPTSVSYTNHSNLFNFGTRQVDTAIKYVWEIAETSSRITADKYNYQALKINISGSGKCGILNNSTLTETTFSSSLSTSDTGAITLDGNSTAGVIQWWYKN